MANETTDEVWIQRDGAPIAVGDMGVDHLRNTLRMIIRNYRRRKERLGNAMQTALSQRDEDALLGDGWGDQ